MPVHIPHGSMFLLLLNLSCYKAEIIFQLCFSVLVRLSRRAAAALHDELSALSTAGGMGWHGVAGDSRWKRQAVPDSWQSRRQQVTMNFTCPWEPTVPQLIISQSWNLGYCGPQSESSRGSSLLCIITFFLFFNKWEMKHCELQDWAAEPVFCQQC